MGSEEPTSETGRQVFEKAARRAQAAEIVARARLHAIELKRLPRKELGRLFMEAFEALRAEALALSIATDDMEEILKDD